jgi:hypothetical protein
MKYPVLGAVIGGGVGFFVGLVGFFVWNGVEWHLFRDLWTPFVLLLALVLANMSAGCCAIIGCAAGFLYCAFRAIRHRSKSD